MIIILDIYIYSFWQHVFSRLILCFRGSFYCNDGNWTEPYVNLQCLIENHSVGDDDIVGRPLDETPR